MKTNIKIYLYFCYTAMAGILTTYNQQPTVQVGIIGQTTFFVLAPIAVPVMVGVVLERHSEFLDNIQHKKINY